MSENGRRLKERLMSMDPDCFEPLTFGELNLGDKFISMPLPGDNHGHGGFRGSHNLFIKNQMEITGYGTPHGRAISSNNVPSDMPHSMNVIKINT